MAHQIDIQHASQQTNIPGDELIERWAQHALERYCSLATTEICIRIIDTEESQTLNAQYRQQNKPTNVLSFPYHDEDHAQTPCPLIGDLAVCAPVLTTEANEQKKSFDAHWAHIIIHGILHLLEYDHIKDEDAKIMEGIEINLMKELGFPNPY